MTKYRRLRAEAGWTPKTYLAEVWGYDNIADVDPDTWHQIEQCAAKRYYLDVVLSRARRRYLKSKRRENIVNKYNVGWELQDRSFKSIISVGADNEEDAREEAKRQLNRIGRRAYYLEWVERGSQVRRVDDIISYEKRIETEFQSIVDPYDEDEDWTEYEDRNGRLE